MTLSKDQALPTFIGSSIYRRSSYGGSHPLSVPRIPQVIDLCRALEVLPNAQYRNSPKARPSALRIWHTERYIRALQEAERSQQVSDDVRHRHAIGTRSNPVFPHIFSRPATAAGAVFLAAGLVQSGGTVFCPAGGTHHGMPDRANGFCYLNDPVLAILTMRRQGLRRIAYVDIDAHHCDGVEFAFERDEEILLVSVHEENRWPRSGKLTDRGAGNVFNLPVPKGFNDAEMSEVLERLIVPCVERSRPEAIVLQCGADAVEEDPLSRLSLSNNAHVDVVRALRPISPRLLVLGGGGYNPFSAGRLWTRVWCELVGQEVPDDLPAAARNVLAELQWEGFRAPKRIPLSWRTTLADPPRPGPVRTEVRDGITQLMGGR